MAATTAAGGGERTAGDASAGQQYMNNEQWQTGGRDTGVGHSRWALAEKMHRWEGVMGQNNSSMGRAGERRGWAGRDEQAALAGGEGGR